MNTITKLELVNLTAVDSMTIMNASVQVDPRLIDQFSRNRRIEDSACYTLIIAYSVLITVGSIGNMLVIIAVLRKPIMRTARNLFVFNLAISDLLICLVTMPSTLMEILTKYWPLGNYTLLCKIIGTLQATSIFASTISITAIALDRYQVIVYPTRQNLQYRGAVLILISIWILALLLASPMFLFKTLVHHDIQLNQLGIKEVAYCIEDWPIVNGRVYYSAFSVFVQYLLPILIVSAAYIRIYRKLKSRIPVGVGATYIKSEREVQRDRRMKRTNCVLISIAVIFSISWLPLNLFNLYADIYLSNQVLTESILVGYAICHITGMSSACSYPIFYGWLNENFRKEFEELLFRNKNRPNIALNGKTRPMGNPSQFERQLVGKSKTIDTTDAKQ